LRGWEASTGALKPGQSVVDLYKHPEDRDPARDYTEGEVSQGGASPEGTVYFFDVLRFYLKHRPAARLFQTTPEMAAVISRATPKASGSGEAESDPPDASPKPYPGYGMSQSLATFTDAQLGRLTFPLAYNPARDKDFDEWRSAARTKMRECLLTPPPKADFDPEVLATDDRGTYEARKLALNISADCRIPAYLLVPKGKGPFPAIIALHDHGAHFSIGKEKVVRPFGVGEAVMQDALKWVDTCYEGRFIGDELAARGYVVFAIDALFWGERGRKEGVKYEAQQELAANLMQVGMTWLGVITWDDIRSAEFVASLPEVAPDRIGAVGLSMGSHRTWMLSAASDLIKAGAAICWMCDLRTLMSPGNNQTTGYSAFSMLAPNLANFLDVPDIASIACPKPMLFYNGEKDGLFPLVGVEAAYGKMRRVWQNQGLDDKLVTKLWPVPHEFNRAMQEEAFAWLDQQLKPAAK
jgi:dienelactone hydrolase